MVKVKKAVIPAAGLQASFCTAQGDAPIVDKPTIEYALRREEPTEDLSAYLCIASWKWHSLT